MRSYNRNVITHFARDDSLKDSVDNLPAFFAWVMEGANWFYMDGLGETPDCCDTLRRESLSRRMLRFRTGSTTAAM